MKKSDFYYDLPKELIAQHPIEPRNASRLMIFHKDSGDVEHKVFSDLPFSFLSTFLICIWLSPEYTLPEGVENLKNRSVTAMTRFVSLPFYKH